MRSSPFQSCSIVSFVSSFAGLTRRVAAMEGAGLDVDEVSVDMVSVGDIVLVKSGRWWSL